MRKFGIVMLILAGLLFVGSFLMDSAFQAIQVLLMGLFIVLFYLATANVAGQS